MAKSKRATEWWRPKAGILVGILCYSIALWGFSFPNAVYLLIASVCTLSGIALIGYFLNDWADIPYDAKVGKPNMVAGIPLYLRIVLITFLFCVAAIPWLVYLPFDSLSLGLLAAEFFFLAAYALPPVRLKNTPTVAIFADALYAYAIPVVLAWHTYFLFEAKNWLFWQGDVPYITYAVLFVWMMVLGLRHIINHHIIDRVNDKLSSTPNLTNKFSPQGLNKLTKGFLFPLEILSATAFFVLTMRSWSVLSIALIGCIAVLGGYRLVSSLFTKGAAVGVHFGRLPMDSFNQLLLALICSAYLMVIDIRFGVLLFFVLVFFSDVLWHPLIKFGLLKLKGQVSLLVNYSIYYFRKWVLRWPEKKNLGDFYDEWQLKKADREKSKLGTVAVFNLNKDKYTETFVKGHISELPFKVVQYYGQPEPVYEHPYGHIISDNAYVLKLVSFFVTAFNFDFRDFIDDRVITRLQKNKVDVILAEFGTTGARLVQVSQKTGIPLIPIFYGYDAWNKKNLEENTEAYRQMFEVAPKVIAVSNDILNQLVKLGCQREKLIYLPCYVNLSVFKRVENREYNPTFLAVGRFAETKAPHLSILAFNEVAEKHSNAKLIMIGKDGGGELFEACQQLVKALGIEERVEFKGIQSSAEVYEAMKEASIFIQHSVTTPIYGDKEGTPVAIMEAMASGMAVIATSHAGIAEVVKHGETGILVEEYDWQAMAREMENLLADKERTMQIGRRASDDIHRNPLISGHIGKLAEIISHHINN